MYFVLFIVIIIIIVYILKKYNSNNNNYYYDIINKYWYKERKEGMKKKKKEEEKEVGSARSSIDHQGGDERKGGRLKANSTLCRRRMPRQTHTFCGQRYNGGSVCSEKVFSHRRLHGIDNCNCYFSNNVQNSERN